VRAVVYTISVPLFQANFGSSTARLMPSSFPEVCTRNLLSARAVAFLQFVNAIHHNGHFHVVNFHAFPDAVQQA
jgi:hypothetical protein